MNSNATQTMGGGIGNGSGNGGSTKAGKNFAKFEPEFEESLKRIQENERVTGLVVVNRDGLPLKSTLDSTLTVQYSDQITSLSRLALSTVRSMDPKNELHYLRLQSKKHEIMVAPLDEYIMFLIQEPEEPMKQNSGVI